MAGARRGQIIDGRFELLARLGRGGMGTVWRARDTALDREVALKEVRSTDEAAEQSPYTEQALRERVLREARALARLNHPNVVRIYHIVDAQPHPWLVMELVEGRDLEARLRQGPLPTADVIRYGRDVLAGLRAAHAAGIHHRDVKPANMLLRAGDGQPGQDSAVLTDFGIAAVAGSATVTVTGNIVGSPEYIAPERIRGAPDHPAADLWSLGMALYVLVEGHSPLRRQTTLATLSAVLESPVPPAVRAGPLAEALTAVLVKDPARRPDAVAFDALLARAQQAALSPGAVPPPPGAYGPPPAPGDTPVTLARRPSPATRRRRRLLAGGLGGALAVGAVVLGVVLLTGGDSTGDDVAGPGGTDGPTAEPTPDDGEPAEPTESGKPLPTDPPAESSEPPPSPDEGTVEPEEPTEPEAPEEPEQSEEPGGSAGTWIAQLFSEPVATGTDTRDQRLAAVRADVPDAEVLRSDDYASLNPGYWVIYAPGPFADGTEAIAYCASVGRTASNECVGRYLSDDPDDAQLVCHPRDGGSGRCETD